MIAEVPISVIVALLETPDSSNIQYVLRSLHSSPSTITKASKAEINHFVSRTINLLNSNDDHKKWFGSHIIQIVGSNPIVLTTNGQGIIVALLKIINDGKTIPVNLKNSSLALNTVIKGIRGKPVLTREVLTPNLPSIIPSLIEKLEKDVITILPILESLVLKNTTTFKPFLNKFEAKLITLLSNENFSGFDASLQKKISTCFAYINLVNQSSNNQNQQKSGQALQSLPDDQWRIKIFQILSELSSVIEIYDNLIDLKEDSESVETLKKLSSKFSDPKNFIFPFLSIDLSDPISIFSISKRINILVKLLVAFITSPTPFPIRVPLGAIVLAGNLLSSLSLNYIPFKRELSRNETLKSVIASDITRAQSIGAELIYEITINYKRLVIPHAKSILSSLEVVIPIEKSSNGKTQTNSKVIKVDEEFALSIESVLLQVIKTSVELFKLSEGITDYDLVNKLIDVSIILLQKRTPLDGFLDKQDNKHLEQTLAQKNNKNKNKKKNKDSTPLADILSHSELFELNPPKATINIILSLFEIISKKFTKISINSRLKVVKYSISHAVEQSTKTGQVSARLAKVLEAIVLYPGEGEVYSFLPIIKRLLPNNEKLSLLTNPRLPPLDTKYNSKKQDFSEEDDDEEEEEEDEEIEQDIENKEESEQTIELELKSEKPITSEAKETIFKTDEEVKTLQFAKSDEEEKKRRSSEEEQDEETPSKRVKIVEVTTISTTDNEVKVTVEKNEESSDDDFEIPEIEIDSDEE